MGTTATENPLFPPLPVTTDERIEWARNAAIRANSEKFRWQAYAQMMTRNPKIKIQFTSGTPCTDGSTIWLRVPIELGNPTPHDRKVCGERHPNLMQQCAACAVLEDVQITMYHEVAHIAFDTFAEMTDEDKVRMLKDAFRLEANGLPDSKRLKKIQRKLDKYDRSHGLSFVSGTKLISPWFGILLNATEDGRVNKKMIDSRPGTKNMFAAQTVSVFESGITQANGDKTHWRDQPLNNQALIIMYCKVFGLDYKSWFDPKVVEDLDDRELDMLVQRLGTARSVQSVYRLCIPTLERLRELGYCQSPEDEEDDPEPEPDPEKQDKPQPGESGEKGEGAGAGGSADPDDDENEASTSGDDDQSDESDDSDDDDAEQDGGDGSEGDDADDDTKPGSDGTTEADSDPEGSDKDGDDSDDSTDSEGNDPDDDELDEDDEEIDGTTGHWEYREMGEPDDAEAALREFGRHDEDGHVRLDGSDMDAAEVERALTQVEFFDAPSKMINGVEIHRNGEGPAWQDTYGLGVGNKIVVPERVLAPALMRLRIAFADNARGSHQRDLRSGRVNGGVLGRRVPTGDDRLFERKIRPGKKNWFVEIGIDVSGSTSSGAIRLLKSAAYAQAELCNRLGVKFAVYAHTGEYSDSGMNLAMYEIKSPADRWDIKARERLYNLGPSSANLDGHTLEFYRKVADRIAATDKLIMYYTDGAMPAENYKEELEILQREIKECRQRRIHIVGIGIGNEDPKKHGLDTIRVDRIEDVPNVVRELEKRLAQ